MGRGGARRVLGAGLVAALLIGSGRADTLTVDKAISFSWNPRLAAVPGLGTATWGTNTAADNNVNQAVAKGPSSLAFALNLAAASLPPTKQDSAAAGAAKAEDEIAVGRVVANPNGTLKADGSVKIDLVTPGGKGGTAAGTGRINLTGQANAAPNLTVNGKAVAANMVAKSLVDLKKAGITFRDPLHLTLTELGSSTPVIDADIFQFSGESTLGAAVGANASGQFELELADDPTLAARAAIVAQTLVPWATDRTGSAILQNGVFTSTGIFNGAGIWALTFSATNPAYVIKATLQNAALLTFDLDFAAPVASSLAHDFAFSAGLDAALVTVPEPTAFVLVATGLLTLGCVRRRRGARAGPM